MDVPGGRLDITASGDYQEIGRYTTIEAARSSYRFCWHHKLPVAYGITFELHNPVVMELGLTHGRCFRVHGGRALRRNRGF